MSRHRRAGLRAQIGCDAVQVDCTPRTSHCVARATQLMRWATRWRCDARTASYAPGGVRPINLRGPVVHSGDRADGGEYSPTATDVKPHCSKSLPRSDRGLPHGPGTSIRIEPITTPSRDAVIAFLGPCCPVPDRIPIGAQCAAVLGTSATLLVVESWHDTYGFQ
jgi:hypothetical protein